MSSKNISLKSLVANHKFLSLQFDFLLFTDILEANLTITVDPDEEIPPGLGQLKATTLLRVLGNTATDPTIKYFGKTAYAVYEVNVPGTPRAGSREERERQIGSRILLRKGLREKQI